MTIFTSHKRIVRNLFGSLHRDEGCTFKDVKILKLTNSYRLGIKLHMFKIVKINMYSSICAGLTLEYPSHRYPTSSRGAFVLPFPRTKSNEISL